MTNKFPLKHKKCEKVIYWYDIKPLEGERACFELIHKVSDEQPDPERGGIPYCHFCKENVQNLGMGFHK